MTSGQYCVRPEAMRSAVGNIGGIILSAMNTLLDLESLIVAPTSFAVIGSSVAGENTAMHGNQVSSLQLLLQVLQDVNGLVKQCADDYESADQEVAWAYGGPPAAPDGHSGLWSSPTAPTLAHFAMNDSAGAPGEPHAVGNVLGYLSQVGMSRQPITDVTFDDANGFADWLDESPHHQARIGVVGVYAGTVRDLGDVPGGVHRGDIVVSDAGGPPVIGVVGAHGTLYNHGVLSPECTQGATIRVYRPTPAAVRM